jgi:hypothetical protein
LDAHRDEPYRAAGARQPNISRARVTRAGFSERII